MSLWDIIHAELTNITQKRRFRAERLKARHQVNWDNVGAFLRPDYEHPQATTMSEAKEKLKEYMEQREVRFAHLNLFLHDNGVIFDETRDSVSAVNQFFATHVYANKDATDIHPNWYFFVWNYSLFLGDLMIKEASPHRKLKWQAFDVSVSKFGEPLRPSFEISGYGSRLHDKDPQNIVWGNGYYMLTHKDSDLTANGRMPHPYSSFSRALDTSLRAVET